MYNRKIILVTDSRQYAALLTERTRCQNACGSSFERAGPSARSRFRGAYSAIRAYTTVKVLLVHVKTVSIGKSRNVQKMRKSGICSGDLRETLGVAQAGVIGDQKVGCRFGLYRLNKRYDRRNN